MPQTPDSLTDREVTKVEFKELYFKYANPADGWTQEEWDEVYEKEEGKCYLFTPPELPDQNRMFISEDKTTRRMFFLDEEAEERFFDHPGKL